MKTIQFILIILGVLICNAKTLAGDGSVVVYHDTYDSWNSSRHIDDANGTVTVGDGCLQLNPVPTVGQFGLHTDVNSIVVYQGDVLIFEYDITSWGALEFADTSGLLLISGIQYGYDPGQTWFHNTEGSTNMPPTGRPGLNTKNTITWTIPVTGILQRADFRLEWATGGSARIYDMKIIRPCVNENVLWHDDLEDAATPPRWFGDATLLTDGSGFITFRSDTADIAQLATEVLPGTGGLAIAKGDLFEVEFKCEDFNGNPDASIWISYMIDSNLYSTPPSGQAIKYINTAWHRELYTIPAGGNLTAVYFDTGYCNGGQFTVYDYKIHRVTPCTPLAGDIEGSSLFGGDFDVDMFDLSTFASNWLDTTGGDTLNTCDSSWGPAYGEIGNNSSAYIDVNSNGPWGNYLECESWGSDNWTVSWGPNNWGDQEDGVWLSGIDVMAGDRFTFDINGPIQDFKVSMKFRLYPGTNEGLGTQLYPLYLHDPNRTYDSDYTFIGDQWTQFSIPFSVTGKFIGAELSPYSYAQKMDLDNFKITRIVPTVRYHDDMQDANTVSGHRTYTNLSYIDGDGYVQISTLNATAGQFITTIDPNVGVYPGDMIDVKFNIVGLPTGGTTNVKLKVTIDGFTYTSSFNPLYGNLGSQSLRFVVPKPTTWVAGKPMPLTKINFYISGTAVGTKINVEDYSLVILPIKVTPGDNNGDKKVDFTDLAIMAQNWMLCTRPDCL